MVFRLQRGRSRIERKLENKPTIIYKIELQELLSRIGEIEGPLAEGAIDKV